MYIKEYLKNQITPILIGVVIGLLVSRGFILIENIVVKIALINAES